MAQYGNSNGGNTGKKYKKRTASTPDSEQRAALFMAWYSKRMDKIRAYYVARHIYDDQIATDTFLRIYDAIMFKGLIVRSNLWYYGVSYNTALLAAQKKASTAPVEYGLIETYIEMQSPDYDYKQYEADNAEFVLLSWQYLRAKYTERECAAFEMFTEGQPKIKQLDIARALGISQNSIYHIIGKMRNDLVYNFAPKMNVCDFYYSNLSL